MDTTSLSAYSTQMDERSRKSLKSHPSKSQLDIAPELDISAIMYKYYLEDFRTFTEEEREQRLAGLDALDMLRTIEQVNNEVATLRLENHILVEFLEKNDPKLLLGLRQRRTSILKRLQNKSRSSGRVGSQAVYGSRQSGSKRSMAMSVSHSIYTVSGEKRKTDYKLNYKAKAEMAEKRAAEVEKRVTDIEKNAMVEIKQLRAKIEELRYRSEETIETEKNFMLHFLRDENDVAFLESATERQIERKLRKFTTNWFKNARALLGTMRLTIVSLQETCQQHRADLITKADLSGILTAVDFEKLIIKRTELTNQLEEKNTHMAGLKGVTGKTSLAMTEEKQAMMNLEAEMRSVLNKTEEVTRAIAKLEKEVAIVQVNNQKDFKILNDLRAQLFEYEAPSVTEYIERKEEAIMLEKEEKMLQRKIYILNMKLNNAMRRKHRGTDF
ncbi:cilia- and flagella-associated protein 263 [Drosophila tropicalis]|uniref:cilia- and flagella-associated protein 263 n=1 Tax=Drosophila tropicalis TaxID=46794 RepID=UPI0035ABBB18